MSVMKKRTHYYVSRKNALTWLMALCLVASAVTRIWFIGVKGAGEPVPMWSQIILPLAATALFALIVLLSGREHFYRTAVPVWMAALYCALTLQRSVGSRLILVLFWIALIFFASLYTDIVTGGRTRTALPIILVALAPLLFLLYYCRNALLHLNQEVLLAFLPDTLALLGAVLVSFAVRMDPQGEYHPTWGDRSDGRRIRSIPAMSQVVPYIMVERNESVNLFSESLEITHIDRYIRQKRKEGLTSFGINHVLLAAYCRCICRYPGLNRFVSGQRVYSRGEDIQYSMTIKKEMRADSPDTCIKVHLSPRDTADDVYRKFQAAVDEVKSTPLDSSFDNTAGLLTLIPGVVLKFAIWLLKLLDYFGLLPKFLLEVSPFHGSLFMTSMGSLGIPPIYHHLYNFGNMPVFGAFGMKRRAAEIQEDGTVVLRKYVDVKFTLDERIVDGYYYAAFFKQYKRILRHPEILDQPPEEVLQDID